MSSKKIWQYPEATSITNDDYILMDSNTETGSQCLKANKIGAVHITKTVTERKVYKASDDNANGFSEVTVAVPYTDVHYDKDDIVSFVGEDLPLKSVTAYIEPQQDLHGYDNPWVGGAGKNKANPDLLLNGYTNPSNRKYDDTTMAKTQFVKTEGLSTITISATNGNRCYVCYYNDLPNVGDEALTNVTQVATSLPQTITVDSSYTYVAIQVCYNPSGANVSNVQVESGSTATTFAPYSNICPISGWSAVDVNVSGVNVWDEEWEQGVISITTGQNVSGNGIRSKNYSNCKGNTSYYFSVGQTADYIMWYDKDKNFINHTYADSSKVVTSPSNAYYFKIRIDSISTYSNNVSVNYPSTDTEYHAYNGHTTTIPFTDGQGQSVTVYGGSVDVVNGGGVSDTIKWTVTPTASQISSCDLHSCMVQIPTEKVPNSYNVTINKCLCNKLKPSNFSAQYDNHIHFPNTFLIAFYLEDEVGNTKQDWVDYLAQAQITVCYKLKSQTAFYTQPTSIKSLEGVNNVWADTGEIAVEWQTLYVTPTT